MTDERLRLQFALQKSGRLTENTLDLLTRCGLRYSRGKDQLVCFGENMPLDLLFVRDDDILDLVQEGVADFGVAGWNVIEEKRLALEERGVPMRASVVQKLDFGRCRLSLAVPTSFAYDGPRSLQGKRIATTYPRLVSRWLEEHAIDAQILTLSGAVEIAPRLGRADVICDLVSTGNTLLANGLREVETVFESQAALLRAACSETNLRGEWASRLLLRIEGVQQVKESKYIMLHAPRSALDAIRRLLPGSESPTVIPLDETGERLAVHAVCRETVFWETLEGLKAAGASAVLVLPVEKMLP